jgi:flagellar hook-basal body protein
MGFSTALYTGISGLQRQQTGLDTIGSNISNANTYGFKSQRVLFNDMLYNTIKSGTAPAGSSAGINPSQVGSGVDISVIDTNFNAGELETTGINTDMAIEGNGFFVLSDGVQQVFTRDGAFSLSQSRVLVSGSTGMAVQGWTQTRDNAGNSTVNTGGAIKNVVIPVGDNRVAKATTEVIFNGNLNNAGAVGTTGTILSSQRLFSSTSDVEVASPAIDLRDVYVKDPAGGVDNVRLFKGSGSASNGDNKVLTAGDKITVQMNKGGRPLEAIFVYGDSDLVDNTTGMRRPDDVPDYGLESYDGTTLQDFMKWFDQAFGLKAMEDQGVTADKNAANGIDGDNPNDLVDMGLDATTPFKDETDGAGFHFLMANSGVSVVSGTAQSPKVAYAGGSAEFNIKGGSGADVGIGSSYIDIDGDSAYNSTKDIMLEGVESYVVSGSATVTKGYQGGTPINLNVKTFFNEASNTTTFGSMIAGKAYIDANGSGTFNADSDILITDSLVTSTDVLGGAATVTASTEATTGKVQLTILSANVPAATISRLSVGHFVENGTTRYYVEKVEKQTSGDYLITLDKSTAWTAAATATFQGAMLSTGGMGYTASTASVVGSTVATTLNLPRGQKIDNKYQGLTISDVMTDNEAGMAGSAFTLGDAKIRIATGVDGVKYAYVDSNGDGSLTETVFNVRHDGTNLFVDLDGNNAAATTNEIVGASTLTTLTAYADNQKVFTDTSGNVYRKVPKVYANGEDKVYLDKGNKGVYDEVRYGVVKISGSLPIAGEPLTFSGGTSVALAATPVATATTVSVVGDQTTRIIAGQTVNILGTTYTVASTAVAGANTTVTLGAAIAAPGANDPDIWVLDTTNKGVLPVGENIVIATTATLATTSTATFNRPNATSINGQVTGSGRIQIRGNIGTANEISNISYISGVDKVERSIFSASALADANGNGYAKVAAATGESVSQNIVVYDSLGKSHDVNVTFVLEKQDNDKSTWRWFAESADVAQKNGIFPAGDPRGLTPSVNVGSGTVNFDNFGRFLTANGATPNSEALFAIPLEGTNTDSTLNIKPDFSILTGFASSAGSQVDVREQNGYAQGVMTRFTVNADGTVTGIYSNGLTETVAQIALAAFANPDGLIRAGGNLFMTGSNSGNAMIGAAGTGERGAIRGEALEQSNVDITTEFTNMIITQRSYQANARVITKADELLQELMQIIR